MLTSIGKTLYEVMMVRDFSITTSTDLKNPESVQLFPSGQNDYLYSFSISSPLPLRNLPRITTYTGSTPGSGIYIGKGSGTPSENDYNLFDRINDSGLSCSDATLGYNWVNGKYVHTLSWMITNSSQTSYTITEIAQAFQIEYRSTPEATSHSSGYVLIEHDMLADPLTLAPGEVGVIEWKREFDFTNFSPES